MLGFVWKFRIADLGTHGKKYNNVRTCFITPNKLIKKLFICFILRNLNIYWFNYNIK